MTARAFLVRGLLAGLLAGLAAFAVAHQLGEPQVAAAVALEQAASLHDHSTDASAGAEHAEAEVVVARDTQRTWGLLTGSLAVGIALGGLVALGAAFTAGRVGRLGPTAASLVVAGAGFVAFALVPFLKYPANPPGVGSAGTIGARSEHYFLFLLVSMVAAVAAMVLTAQAWPRLGTWVAVALGVGSYVAIVVTVGVLLPTATQAGDFPADLLWYFRRASLITLATLWGALGIALSGLLSRLEKRQSAVASRRAFAASL